MEISVFIRILRSRLEELSLSAEYIDKKCADTEKYLLKVPLADRDAVITENYLTSIIEGTVGEAERLAVEDRELELSVASILEKARASTADIPSAQTEEEKKEDDTSDQYYTYDAPTLPPQRIKRSSQAAMDTRFATGGASKKGDRVYETAPTVPPKKREKRSAGSATDDGGKTRPGGNTTNTNDKKSEASPPQKRDVSKKINETELYNSRPTLIFVLLLILFSPTLLLILSVIFALLLATVLVFSIVTAALVVLPFALIFVGCIISVISLSYSFSLVLSGEIFAALSDMGIFLIAFSLTAVAAIITRTVLKKALPFLSLVITRSYKFVFRAIKTLLTKCRKGCATL